MENAFTNITARVVLLIVVVMAVVYKAFRMFIKKPWVEEMLTVAMFVGGIGLVLALAIPGSHLLVAVAY